MDPSFVGQIVPRSLRIQPEAMNNSDFEALPSFPRLTAARRWATRTALLCLAVAVSGCFGKRFAERKDEVVDVPESYGDAPTVEAEPLDRWCSDFGSSRLEQLVQRAFDDNLDLQASWARLEQAATNTKRAFGARTPNIDGEIGVSRRPQPSLPENIDVDRTEVQASLVASYEVDLWGKLADRHKAAIFDERAARAQVETMAISLTSQIAEAWFNLVHQRARKELLERQIEVSRRFLKSTALRLGQGQASALDVNQQRQQVESLRGRLATTRAQIETAAHRLAVLVGEPPQRTVAGERDQLPEVPKRPSAGVPADLLNRRPDVRAALYQLEAADHRAAAALKERFPSIRLSAQLFYQAPTVDELFEDLFWQAIGTVSQQIFGRGIRWNETNPAEARAKVRLYEYGSAVLTALREVQDAMILEAKQKEFVESLRTQRQSAREVYQLARQRYSRGATDYLRVLTAFQSLQNTEQALLDARRQQLSFRLQLCRALGGTWTREMEAPERFEIQRRGTVEDETSENRSSESEESE